MSQAPAVAAPTPVLPYMGPIRPGHTVALIFEQSGTTRLFAFPFTTLADAAAADQLLDFYNHPLQCGDCRRPFKRTTTGCLTFIFTCPHWPDDTPDSESNRAVAAVIPSISSQRMDSPLGNVLVVKQAALAPSLPDDQPVPRAQVMALPLVDVTLADLPDIRRYLVEFLPAMWTVDEDGWRYFIQDEAAEGVRAPNGERIFKLRGPQS
ncbi:hypothetical protein C8F01DRAFT_1263639 [Mycena amicta]|nr:hypothetical protein C8F01DRAFT_1263639 [Mycena amicta]